MTDLVRTNLVGVAWLQLNRPESRNALTTDLLVSLRSELTAIRDDPTIRVVVFSGSGDVFCAGADIKEFSGNPSAQASLARVRLVAQVLTQIRGLEQPTIAAVNGPAMGAGWGLSLACDLAFTVADARYCLPEVAKGFRLPAPLVNRLIQVVGPVRAAEIVLGGATYDADQAIAWGWATRLLNDRETLTDHTWQFATELASRPRHSLAAATQPLRRNPSSELSPPPEYAWNEE